MTRNRVISVFLALGWFWGGILWTTAIVAAEDAFALRTQAWLAQLSPGLAQPTADGLAFAGAAVAVVDCDDYPYHRIEAEAEQHLVADLAEGIQQGLSCLSGQGPQGELHPYHRLQAERLLELLESPQLKTFRCVADRMFANAVATTNQPPAGDDRLLRDVRHPSVLLDTFRIGGLLSTAHTESTYRDFFKLNDEQIREHLTGSPLRLDGNHRYQNMPALLFHELVHWLGHEHSAIYPDVTHLYETCCFGGSDYIDDAQVNQYFQAKACGVLRDAELWDRAHNSYQQMRFWHHKGYDQLKAEMRDQYY